MATYFRTHSTNLAKRILVHRNRDLRFKDVSEKHSVHSNRRTNMNNIRLFCPLTVHYSHTINEIF